MIRPTSLVLRRLRRGLAALALPLLAHANPFHFDLNGPVEGSGVVSGSYPWSGATWSTDSAGRSATGTLPSRNTVVFSAGVDGFGRSLTLTGASGEIGGVIVEEGDVIIQSLTRIFVNNSVLRTRPGTSLTIQNSPDFYNNTVTLDTAAGTTLTLAGINSGGSRNAKLVKTGPGLVLFQGANIGSSGGTLTVQEGEYRLLHGSALADGASVVNSGGTLSLANNLTVSRALTLHGAGHASLGALRSVSGSNTWTGLLTLGSPARIAADAASTLTLAPASGDAITGPFALSLGGAGNITVSRPISAVASLTKDGPGTLTLAAQNPFTGPTTVSAGTLRFVETSGVLGSVAGPVLIDAELLVVNASSATWSSALSGSGRFVKQGAGTLSLSGSHPFAGTLALESGTLALSGASFTGPLRLEIAASATLSGNLTVASGQSLAGSGSLAGTLAFAAGSTFEPSPGAPLTVSGSASFAPGATLRLPSSLPNGTHVLLRSTGGTLSGLGGLSLTGFTSLTQIATLQLNAGSTELSVLVSNNPYAGRNLVWAGDGSANLWDTSTPNFRASGSPAVFATPDAVLFDATAGANSTVTLLGTLVPASLTVSSATDYTLTGSGSLAGPMTLAKSGAGRLTLTGPHTFTGNTTLSGGTLELRVTGALGTSPVANSAALALAPAPATALHFGNPVSGPGALAVSGGSVTLSGANTFTGPVTVASGTLLLGHPSALGATSGATTVSSGATLDLAGQALGAEPITLAGGTLRNSATAPASLSGPLTVTAPATLRATSPLTFSGPLTGNAALSLAEGTLVFTGPSPATAASLTIAPGATLAGSGTLGGNLTLSGTLSPSALSGTPSTLTVRGSAILASSSTLALRLSKSNGTPASDRLVVHGPLTLGGTLQITLSGEPLAAGDSFTLFSAASVDGDFASVALPFLYADLIWDRSDLARTGVLRVIRLPAVSTAAQRREFLLAEASANPASIDAFVLAAAAFARGQVEEGRALALARSRSLVAKIRSSPVQVDLFDMWPAADLALRFGSHLDAETLANIRESLTTFTQYKDTVTSNLRTLAWVTRHLGGLAFGEEGAFTSLNIANFWRANDPNAANELNTQLAAFVRGGFGEHASRPYYWKNLLPILSIAQLAADPALRNRASLAYEAGLAQNVHSWLRGHLGSPTSRSYPDVLRQQPISSLGMLWFHFGGDVFPRNNEAALFTAVMNQTVSPLLELAASDRSTAFASRAFLGNAHHSAWADRDYILFSDGPRSVGNFQVYPNGVVWAESDTSRNSFLWVAKPWRDDSGLNVSNPHGRNTAHYKETQSRDAALYIFDIPADDPFPYALSYVPGGYRAVLNEAAGSGAIFLHYGSVLIAIRSELPFTWNPAGGVAFFSETPHAGDSEFRIFGTRFAVALETAHPADFPAATAAEQLAAFRAAVLARPAPSSAAGTPPLATYTSRSGDVLQVARSADPATRPISHNGAPLNFNTWPVLESPWTFQDSTGPLVLRSPTRRELLDFTNWTRSVQTAPVLGPPASALALAPGQTLDIDLALHATASPESPGPLAFTVGDAVNGSVSLLADGRTARFTAGAAPGAASFRFSARAAGVDPSRLALLYDYEDDLLSTNSIADLSGHRLTATTGTVGTGTRSLSADVPPALAGLSSSSLQLNQPSATAAARVTRALAVTDHDLSDADWTFATWVRRASSGTHDMVFYLGSGDGFGGSGDELYLYFPANSNTLRLHHYNTANVLDLDLVTPATASAGAWHHVALTFTRTALNTGVVRLYLNGALAATSTPLTWALNQSSPLVIGGNNSTTGSGPERWLDGRLDDTALFTRALSASELAALSRMSVSQFTGLESSATIPLTVLTGREQWRLTHFGTTSNTGPAADLADPDGDGLPNLLEYALNLVPTAPSLGPTLSLAPTLPHSLALTFLRARAELTYTVEASSTLAPESWQIIATNPGTVGQQVTVTDSVSLGPATPRRFLRLRVTIP